MKQSFAAHCIAKAAKKLGIRIDIEPLYKYTGRILLPGGRKRYFKNTSFDVNMFGASEVARDKAYTYYFIKSLGYPIPEGREFFSYEWATTIGSSKNPDSAYKYVKRIKFPVIVKPNSKSQGLGVEKVYNKREFMRAVRKINDNVFLVQKVVYGKDYRIVVLDRKVVAAYQRIPLSVVGDGISSIQKLIANKLKALQKSKRKIRIPINDKRIDAVLRHSNISWSHIPENGERIVLLPAANLSSGGDAIDVTETINSKWRKLAARLSRDMNLAYCGIDIMTSEDITKPPKSYVIMEVNSSPGLENYASIGIKQRKAVYKIYEKVVKLMVK